MWWKCNVAGVVDSRSRFINSAFNGPDIINGDGMLMDLKTIRAADVIDGTSNTLFVGEVTGAGPGTGVVVGMGWEWMDGSLASTGCGINGDGTIPGSGKYLKTTQEVGFSSYHPGGCHFLMVDGSAQYISQNIAPNVLRCLTTRAGKGTGAPPIPDDVLVSGAP